MSLETFSDVHDFSWGLLGNGVVQELISFRGFKGRKMTHSCHDHERGWNWRQFDISSVNLRILQLCMNAICGYFSSSANWTKQSYVCGIFFQFENLWFLFLYKLTKKSIAATISWTASNSIGIKEILKFTRMTKFFYACLYSLVKTSFI